MVRLLSAERSAVVADSVTTDLFSTLWSKLLTCRNRSWQLRGRPLSAFRLILTIYIWLFPALSRGVKKRSKLWKSVAVYHVFFMMLHEKNLMFPTAAAVLKFYLH